MAYLSLAPREDRFVVPPGTARMVAYVAILLAAILGITTQVLHISFASPPKPALGTLSYQYQRGYYLDHGWLCYGWSSGAFHCTAHWHYVGNTAVSDNVGWVPRQAGLPAVPAGSLGKGPATMPATQVASSTAGQPCRSATMFVPTISQWTVPPSCYANVYTPNPANYVYRSGFGWCNWWPEVLHPAQPDILWGSRYHRSGVPTPGAAVAFAGGVQGADLVGHFAQVVGVAPGGTWVLISEMNFLWRGAGFGKVNYRYIHVGPGVTFITA